jgi:heat-inducible transcriptional repressor
MLTTREETILNLIVDDYIRVGTPIASQSLARNHSLGVSSATIRNDVADLAQEGYITRPHSSAGSVPLDKGYRVYVESVASNNTGRISQSLREVIRRQLAEVERDMEEWTSVAASLLARLVDNMAITTFPKARQARVRHIDLVVMQDFVALLVVVFEQAKVGRQIIWLKEAAARSELEMTANKMNDLLQGLTREQIESRDLTLSPLEEELVETTVLMLEEEDRSEAGDHYLDGLSNLLAQPEFSEKERMRAVVEGVEDGTLALAILKEAPEARVVRVVIGQENRGEVLRPLSVVLGQYGIPGQAAGTVGAVGPVRMEYGRTIACVELMTIVMSEMIENGHLA